MFKTKSIKVNNPHIQKKKKENKRVRKLSNAFQKTVVNTEAAMKTPEESICSNDITTNHGVNIEDKFSSLGGYLLQQQVSSVASNGNSQFAEDTKSIQSRLNETSDSKQINLTSDTSSQMTPKVQFRK